MPNRPCRQNPRVAHGGKSLPRTVHARPVPFTIHNMRLNSILASLLAWLLLGSGASAQQPGTLRWSFPSSGPIFSTPAFSPVGNVVYFGSQDKQPGKFYAINISSGGEAWEIPSGPVATSPAVAPDGTVYYGTFDATSKNNALYALNPDGSTKWRFAVGAAGVRS